MKTKTKKACWSCKRALVGDSKLGLCPDCINKFGTPAVALVMLGLGVIGKQAFKHGGKIVKGASKIK